jgi:hypothetical protein
MPWWLRNLDGRDLGGLLPDWLHVIDGSSPQPRRTSMASSGKKKTTMAKLTRESRLRERRLDKQARKDARKRAAAGSPQAPGDAQAGQTDESAQPGTGEGAARALTDA